MKNRKLIIGCAAIAIVAIVVFFIAYAGKRGVGTYASQTYAGCYDQPDPTRATLVVTAEPGEQLQVTHVSKKGWATVDYPGHGSLYTNFFSLTPEDVRYPIHPNNFYDGSEALLLLDQLLLWAIFVLAGIMLACSNRGGRKATFVATILLVGAELVYAVLYLAYIAPADVLFGSAFNGALAVVLAFVFNMAGLVLLGFAHMNLIRTAFAAAKKPGLTTGEKFLTWALAAFVVLFTVYIAIQLIVMALVVAAVVAGLLIAASFLSFALDYERSHVTLTKDPYSGKWMNGNKEYVVNEATGKARKKRLFEL